MRKLFAILALSLRKLELRFSHIDDLPSVAKSLKDFCVDATVWLFEGEMGVGKTTLIKTLCALYEVQDNVSSPTFSIVNEYRTKNHQTIYHFDFYRLKDESEALGLGLDEYFYSNHLCFIEWGSMIPSFLPDNYYEISISKNKSERILTIKLHGARSI